MALSVLKDIRKVFSGLNADEIRGISAQEISVGLMASNEAALRQMEDFLAPPSIGPHAQAHVLRSVRRIDGSARPYDFVLCEPGRPVPANGYHFDTGSGGAASNETLIPLILEENPKLETALARTFPTFRPAVASKVIGRVARENALFSIVTALPNIVPNLLELPWAVGEFATDTAFLTTNQMRMALILAASYGRPVGYMEQKTEMVGIVAGAFGWRAIARELVGKIPLGGGLIPKAAVAFAGTYVVGLSLDKLNRTGTRLSRAERRDAYADAFVKGKDVVRELAPSLHQNKDT